MKITIHLKNPQNPSVSMAYQQEVTQPLNIFLMDVQRLGFIHDPQNKRIIPWHAVALITE